jgi:hypothetical protein
MCSRPLDNGRERERRALESPFFFRAKQRNEAKCNATVQQVFLRALEFIAFLYIFISFSILLLHEAQGGEREEIFLLSSLLVFSLRLMLCCTGTVRRAMILNRNKKET